MKTKPFTIYRQWTRTEQPFLWEVHRRYETVAQMKAAMKDLTRTPLKLRYYRYIPLPSLHPTSKVIELKDNLQKQAR